MQSARVPGAAGGGRGGTARGGAARYGGRRGAAAASLPAAKTFNQRKYAQVASMRRLLAASTLLPWPRGGQFPAALGTRGAAWSPEAGLRPAAAPPPPPAGLGGLIKKTKCASDAPLQLQGRRWLRTCDTCNARWQRGTWPRPGRARQKRRAGRGPPGRPPGGRGAPAEKMHARLLGL